MKNIFSTHNNNPDSVPNNQSSPDTKSTSSTNTITPIEGTVPIIGSRHQGITDEHLPYDEESDFVTAALWWLGFGFQVIPLVPNTKSPAVKWDPWLNGLSDEKIKHHWKAHPTHELGFIVGEDYIVLDADSPMATAALAKLEQALDIIPNLTVDTAKGQHHYFRCAKSVFAKTDSHSTERHPARIDVKTGRSLVILPPSTGKSICIDEAEKAYDLTEATQEFIDAAFRHNGREAPREHVATSSPRLLLASMSQVASRLDAMLSYIDPDCGYEDWLHVLMAIFHSTGGSEEGFALADSWSSSGKKYRGEDEVRSKWNSFESHAGTPITIGTINNMLYEKGIDWIDVCASNEPQFERCEIEVIYPEKHSLNTPSVPANPPARSPQSGMNAELDTVNTSNEGTTESGPDLEPLAWIQRRYALINMTGHLWVLEQQRLKKRLNQATANKLVLSNRGDGSLLITRSLRSKYPDENASKISKAFFSDPGTICFDGVEFNPAGTSENHLNLWTGPTIDPKLGKWPLIKSFLFDVICGGDDMSYHYLIQYIAHALQHPEEKPGVILIMLGGQGTGKGTLGRIMRLIWSATFLLVHNIDTVTGNFNASLERAFIVFLDEALFVGNRRSTDVLKSLVTEPVIQINEKHQPARQINSYHRFIAATNADHMKHTDKDDRRDFVLRVAEDHKGDHAYWRKLNHEIDNGGVEAMVHDLLVMDLSVFNVRNKPETRELLEQKLQSLEPIERWWHDCLQRGGITEDDNWQGFISTADAIEGVMEIAGGKIYKKPTFVDLVRTLTKLCPSAKRKQQTSNHRKRRGFVLPSLEQARKEFEEYIGGKLTW